MFTQFDIPLYKKIFRAIYKLLKFGIVTAVLKISYTLCEIKITVINPKISLTNFLRNFVFTIIL